MEYGEAGGAAIRRRGLVLVALAVVTFAGVGFAVPSLDDGSTSVADASPAISNLDPDLRDALDRAAQDARKDGVRLRVTSGWRSAAHQQELLDRAVSEYGTAAEALRWVSTPETSAHVTGDAVDIGPDAAIAWLSEHGASYGLCQIYRNEPWHYELRPGAADHGCPTRYADPTHDPRMQR